ncbi:MAG: hypothetical protein ABFD60_01730 [Bryobacteraceae bacterium]
MARSWHKITRPVFTAISRDAATFAESVRRALKVPAHVDVKALDAVWGRRKEMIAVIREAMTPLPVEAWAQQFTQIITASAAYATARLERDARRVRKAKPFPGYDDDLPLIYEEAARIARETAGELAKGLSEEQLAVIRDLVSSSLRGKYGAAQMARMLAQPSGRLGLNQRFARAVENLETTLTERGEDPDRIETLTTRYADRLLRVRSKSIAQTETMRSMNQGTEASWAVAMKTGLIDNTTRRVWIASPDACEFCLQMDGEETGVDEPWETDDGPVDTPQDAHPNCRCTEGLMFVEEEEEEPEAEDAQVEEVGEEEAAPISDEEEVDVEEEEEA